MRHRIFSVLILGMVACMVSVAQPMARDPMARAAPEQVYIALGDSIAAGQVTTLPRKRGYPALVQDLLSQQGDVTLQNLAVPGETAQSFLDDGQLERFEAEIASLREREADLVAVTISLGGNEMLNLTEAGEEDRAAGLDRFRETFPATLDAIDEALGDLQPVVAVTTYYDLTEGTTGEAGSDAWWLAQFNQVIRDASSARGYQIADIEPVFRGRIRELTWYPTDIHPNNEGHAEIARTVWQALEIDEEAPRVSLERPNDGMVSRQTPTIRVTATDNVGVDAVELWVDGEYAHDLIYLPTEEAWVGLWDGRGHQEDSVTLRVRVTDLAGNETVVDRAITVPAR